MIKQQKCGSCRYAIKCYSEKTSPRNVVINILACRIRNNINKNESAKLLLEMVRPNLIKLVNNARSRVGSGYIDVESLILDLESRIIESLISEDGYRIGEAAYLTEYLFGTNPKTGWVKKWILWHFSKHQRFYHRHISLGTNPESDTNNEISENDRISISDQEIKNTDILDDSIDNTVNTLFKIINDGITLNANEFRVMSFCLSHANESNRHRLIDGTHTYLSTIMGVSRPRITRLYAVGRKKLLHVAKQRGIGLN